MSKDRNEKTGRQPSYRLPISLNSRFVSEFSSLIDSQLESGLISDETVIFKLKWLKSNWLAKYSDTGTTSPDDRRSAAIAKWLKMECRNRETNERLVYSNPDFGPARGSDILSFARTVVRQIIGRSPPEDILSGGFTNGASTRIKRGPTAIAQKYMGKAHASTTALPHFKKVLQDSPAWVAAMFEGNFSLEPQENSVLFTVPKNSEIDRVACKEPEINMYLQRGVGDYFRAKLKQRGIDLNDQSRNRELARQGSADGLLATLDLSSASDLISTKLVSILLPRDWFSLLDDLRVKTVEVDGEIHTVQMFSSMGNGFTFELESLIFYALSCSINYHWKVRGRISVYGDDIITPTSIARLYPRVFSWLGFIINVKKSCFKGPFRESCGGHFHHGCDVTPFYLRKPLVYVDDLTLMLNSIRKWGTQHEAAVDFSTRAFFKFWSEWSIYVPRVLWGGKDVEDKTSLVTHHAPRKRLVEGLREVACPQQGAYLHWLHIAGRRRETPDGSSGFRRMSLRDYALRFEATEVVTSVAFLTTKRKLYRNRTWERVLDLSVSWIAEVFY